MITLVILIKWFLPLMKIAKQVFMVVFIKNWHWFSVDEWEPPNIGWD